MQLTELPTHTAAIAPDPSHDLELCQVTKKFGSQTVLNNINLSIAAGEFVAIMGPSGCGKTTLLRVIAGLESMSAGKIYLDSQNIARLPVHRRNTPMVWQNYALFPHLTVQQNIAFGLTLSSHQKAIVREKVYQIAAMLHLENFLDRRISQLSGGQKQRVAIARALVTEPKILLLDEPMSALDPHLRIRMQGELKRLQQALGITFIYVTHNQNEAFSMADRIVVMNRGNIEQVGSPSEIYNRPASHFVAEFVGYNNLLDGKVVQINSQTMTIQCSQTVAVVQKPDRAYSIGEQVTVVIPADRMFVSSDSASENSIKAVLRGQEFMGSQILYVLETEEGCEIKMIRQETLNTSQSIPVNSELHLAWSSEDAIVLGEPITHH